jgi:hypothetical protein
MDLWIMACIVDGKPFDLAYLFLKHMSNVIKGRQRRALVFRAILTEIFNAFDVNMGEYKDDRDVRRYLIYDAIKLSKLGMICIDNVGIYDPSIEPSASKLELRPRQRSLNIGQQLLFSQPLPSYQP